MDFKKINRQVIKIEQEIKNIKLSSISHLRKKYFLDKHQIDVLNPNYEFEYLCELHLKIYKIIRSSQLDAKTVQENRDIIDRLISLKIRLDRLIIENPSYSKSKFLKKFKDSINKYKSEYLIYQGKRNKTAFLNNLTEYLIKGNYINEIQTEDFKKLFKKMKMFELNEKIIWKKDIVELRGLYDAIDEIKIIKRPKNSDLFIENNFLDNKMKEIKSSYFANLVKPDRCQDYINDWIDIFKKIEQIE